LLVPFAKLSHHGGFAYLPCPAQYQWLSPGALFPGQQRGFNISGLICHGTPTLLCCCSNTAANFVYSKGFFFEKNT
jgi:hypothetical protein